MRAGNRMLLAWAADLPELTGAPLLDVRIDGVRAAPKMTGPPVRLYSVVVVIQRAAHNVMSSSELSVRAARPGLERVAPVWAVEHQGQNTRGR